MLQTIVFDSFIRTKKQFCWDI